MFDALERNNIYFKGMILLGLFVLTIGLWLNKHHVQGEKWSRHINKNELETIDSAADKAWVSQAIKQIQSEEYSINREKGGALTAPNRKHNLRVRFSMEGIEFRPRTTSAIKTNKASQTHKKSFDVDHSQSPTRASITSEWNWIWRTNDYGRQGAFTKLKKVNPLVDGNKIVYSWPEISEWYTNKPEGIEQGFVIKKSPIKTKTISNRADFNWVYLRSEPIEGLILRCHSDVKILLMNQKREVVLEYSKLVVKDAANIPLPCRLQVEDNQVIIAYNDLGAKYPVYIDPLFTSTGWSAEGNQAEASFGYSVAGAGDVNGDGYGDVIIGVPTYDNGETDEGRAYVFFANANGLNTSPSWVGEGNQSGAQYGYSVSSAGDVNGDGYSDIIIGAPYFDDATPDNGRAYLHLGSAEGVSSTAIWVGDGDSTIRELGYSVSCAGDVNGDGFSDVIVGAPLSIGGDAQSGKALVYLGSALGVSTTPTWQGFMMDDLPGYRYGHSVASAGDVNGDGYSDVIIGEPNDDSGEGRALVYYGRAGGVNSTPGWTVELNQANAHFAYSVAGAGDVNADGYCDVIVGAPDFDNGQNNEGQVFLYLGSATGLSSTPIWSTESNQADAFFGGAVAGLGDINGDGYGDVIIGSRLYDNGEINEGVSCIYLGNAGGLSAAPEWVFEGGQANAGLGCSVSSAGDINGDGYSDIIIGANGYDNDQTNEGRAYVYFGSADSITATNVWTSENDQANSQYGYSVTNAGDVNGDGFGDLAIGAPFYDTGLANIGRVFIYQGKVGGFGAVADQTLEGTQANELFGWSVSTAGDVNCDGYADLLIGAPQYSNGESNEGRVYLFSGSGSGVIANPVWLTEGNQTDSQLGFCVACAGDVNGDGYSDILASAPYHNNQGRVSLYAGSGSGLLYNPLWFADGKQAEEQFGFSAASAGDINGDGFSDIMVGAPYYDNGQTDEGRACLYNGHTGGLSPNPTWSRESDQTNAQYGRSVSAAGDVNGDGFSDVIIGAPYFDNTQSNEGRVYVYHGSAGGLSTNISWTAYGGQNSVQFGFSVTTAGDVDNDGFGDVAVGAHQYPNGRAYIYHGGSSGLASSPERIGEGDQASSQFGYSVASAGDIDGDGFGDIVIGAPLYDNGQTDEGMTFLYYGNSRTGYKTLPRQLRPDDLKPIGPSGIASIRNNNTDFLIRLFAHGSQGRIGAKLQAQIAPVGQPLTSGMIYNQPTYTDLGVFGKDLNLTVSGLNAMQAYHWRVRLVYDPSKSINSQLYGPWQRMAWGSLNGNADFRTGPVIPATPTPTAVPTVQQPDGFLGQLIDTQHFFVYPNPSRGTNVKFRFFLKQPAEVEIKVYTPQNKYVWEKVSQYPSGWNEIIWNAAGMANGVYFYTGKATNGNTHEKIIKKLGLIK